MSIGLYVNEEENVDLNFSTVPLKIPIPKNNKLVTTKCSSNITLSTTNSSFIGSLPKKIVLKCDSPQIFSIESKIDFGESRAPEDGGLKKAETACSGATGTAITTTTSTQEPAFEGYRELGTSSGFNSDLDSESPFYSSDVDSDTSEEPPLMWNFADYFANLPGNDWCVRVPHSFIEDEFNLFELPNVFRCSLTLTDETVEKDDFDEYGFDDLIDFITVEELTGKMRSDTKVLTSCVEDPIPKISDEMLQDSILLYKLIHQRFIITKAGLQAMWEKFDQQTFGTCPRYYCHEQPLLPVGLSALPGKETARVYCLNCQDLYVPSTLKHSKMDGMPFGPSFAHFFVRTVLYSNETKALENRKGSHDWQIHIPKIYGFRIFKENKSKGIRDERPVDFK